VDAPPPPFPAPPLPPSFPLPLRSLPELPLRRLTPIVFLHSWDCLPYLCGGEKVQHCLAAPPVGEELVSLPPPSLLRSLLPYLLPQHPLLLSPLRAPLQEVLSRLPGVRAPPALGCRPGLCPVQVLPRAAVPRLQLVEPFGKPFGAPSHRTIGSLTRRHPVLLFGGPTSSPPPCLCPLLLGDLSLDACKRPGERHRALLWPVRVGEPFQPFHPSGIQLFRRQLRPLVCLLIAFHALMCGAPPNLNDDV